MEIDLGILQIPEGMLYRHLRSDLRDDWFPDPLGYADMIDHGVVREVISKNFEAHHGEYVPSLREIYNIPKDGFTLRYALETGLSDRALYHGLTAFIVPYVDPLIPWYVFSHRYDRNRERSRDRSLFRSGIPSWRDFTHAVQSTVSSDKWLLSTDLSNYFEHIDLTILKQDILALVAEVSANFREKSKIRAHVELLFGYLRSWSFDQRRGLPQNRDASSFLANVYMRRVDRAMNDLGYSDRYFRYMDDIKVVCHNEFEARLALKQLSLQLREIGLSINSRKTEIVPGADADRVSKCIDSSPEDVSRLDALWSTKTRQTIRQFLPLLKQTIFGLIERKEFGSRSFRYCIRRLAHMVSAADYIVPRSYYEDVTRAIISAIRSHPACSDQYIAYLEAVETRDEDMESILDFVADDGSAIYSWQNYRLWLLLARKGFTGDHAVRHARRRLKERDDATRAGATIYLGSVGGVGDRNEVAAEFRSLASFMGQRAALIAVHELPYSPVIRDLVRPYLRSDLAGVYKEMQKGSRKGKYFLPLERHALFDSVEEGPSYE
jgi:hypothetical protein